MRTEGCAKRMTIATLIPRGAAVMDVSPADLTRERTWRVQAEAWATAAEERAAVSAGLVARLRGEMTGAEPWGRRWWRPWSRRATRLWLQPAERRGEDRCPPL